MDNSFDSLLNASAVPQDEKVQAYIKKMGLEDKMANATHIPWATGGSLVPQDIREEYMHTHLK